jgi:hypothetical protein
MARKKIVRKPIEKLSEKEHIEVIEDSSSSEEEFDDIPAPPKLVKEKPKRERSAKQLANDQRLRDAAAARKAGKAKPAPEPVKETPQQDPDDKPLTMKEYKALLASQKTEEKPAEVKPKRKYVKKEKKVAQSPPTPAPSPTPTPPSMMFV